LSDATPDRYDDIIMSEGWELDNFKKNPIALFGHSGSFPIGKWKNIKIKDGALHGTLELAPVGTSDRIDEIHKLVDADILRAVSVGFTPLEYKERKGDTYGMVYTKQELVECSLVAVPANPNALMVAKQLSISFATRSLVFDKPEIIAVRSRVQQYESLQTEIDAENKWIDQNGKINDPETDERIKKRDALEKKQSDLWTF
jgi:HK97 family phage prohead protease